ncbi:hypothetical protein EVAR_41253_1 [Eumeta japonica]|uniref:Uncharacterized protein n=1 Tax=Eumeta variegata TaxID=151549 RepID=A0A4C1W4G9_EUMVA|nr:hypothetical protein EVAR_41253_1 [Eumeta japonica]
MLVNGRIRPSSAPLPVRAPAAPSARGSRTCSTFLSSSHTTLQNVSWTAMSCHFVVCLKIFCIWTQANLTYPRCTLYLDKRGTGDILRLILVSRMK